VVCSIECFVFVRLSRNFGCECCERGYRCVLVLFVGMIVVRLLIMCCDVIGWYVVL